MTRHDLIERLDNLAEADGDFRRQRASQIANADESLIQLLCQIWSECSQPMRAVENRSGFFFRVSVVLCLIAYAGNIPLTGPYAVLVRTAFARGIFLLSAGVAGVIHLLRKDAIRARQRHLAAADVLACCTNVNDLPDLLAHCYCSRSAEEKDKVLVLPAIGSIDAILKQGYPLTINYLDPLQLDSIRLLLTRPSDLSNKRELVLEVLRTLERDEAVELIAEVRTASKAYNDTHLRNVAGHCLSRLEEVVERRNQAYVLLRPTEENYNAMILLKPAVLSNSVDAKHLLRESHANHDQFAQSE